MEQKSRAYSQEFKKSGLLQNPMVEKAFLRVKDNERAIGIARILSEMMPVPDVLAGLLLAFDVEKKVTVEDAEREYSGWVSELLPEIRGLSCDISEVGGQRCSQGAQGCMLASAVWHTERLLAQYEDASLSDIFMSSVKMRGQTMLTQMSVEQDLRRHRRRLEEFAMPMAEKMHFLGHERVLQRFRKTLNALDLKIALPEVLPALKQQRFLRPS